MEKSGKKNSGFYGGLTRMDIIQIVRIVTDWTYSGINFTSRIRYIADLPKYKKIIKRNQDLKDKCKGETCYILGNGPSIKNLDISLLKGKHTFAVNGFYESPLYDQLRPEIYCVYDKFEFAKRRDSLQKMVDMNDRGMLFLFNRRAIGKIQNDKNCYYVYSNILPTNHNNCYDLTKDANTFINVLGFCVMCAIYMGFNRIVLLGNDFSRFTSRNQHHFYDVDKHIERKESMFQELQGNAIAINQHELLYRYCKERGIEIVNATQNSLMDVYTIVNLNDYL